MRLEAQVNKQNENGGGISNVATRSCSYEIRDGLSNLVLGGLWRRGYFVDRF